MNFLVHFSVCSRNKQCCSILLNHRKALWTVPPEKSTYLQLFKKLFIPCMDYYIYLSHPNTDVGYIVCKSWYVSRRFYQLFFLLSCFPPGAWCRYLIRPSAKNSRVGFPTSPILRGGRRGFPALAHRPWQPHSLGQMEFPDSLSGHSVIRLSSFLPEVWAPGKS